MRSWSLALCFLLTSLHANPVGDSGALSSTNAAYDGSALILTGKVRLDHGLGQMAAERASLERQDAGKDFPFSLIHLQNEVVLTLKNSAEIRCETADLDFLSLKGFLFSKENEKVVYSDSLSKKKGEKTPFKMLGKVVELGLGKKAEEGKKAEYELETILAKEEVVINYDESFILHADHAIYRALHATDKRTKSFQGTISAYPKDPSSKCRLIHDGDDITADSVDLDLIHSKLSLLHPEGTLLTKLAPNLQKGNLNFRADHLSWDHTKNLLTLKGKVRVEDSSLGILTSEEDLQILQGMQKDKRYLKTISSKGTSTLQYKDSEDHTHKLYCHGPVTIDREHLNATLNSPLIDGSVPEVEQIYYEDEKLGVYSDNASLEYSLHENSLQPASLSLIGNIRLFSLDPSQKRRCAVADRLNYSPTTRTLILYANPGKKVLYWDEEDSIHVSAHEVHITQDPNTKKEAVKGLGNVQFAFSFEENNLLQKVFSFFPGQKK